MRHAVIFDLDGTLADSAQCVAATMNAALVAHGFPAVPEADVHRWIGVPLVDIAAHVAPEGADAEAVAATYRALYPPIADRHERLFPGVIELLTRLQADGRPLAIATGKSQHGADNATARLGLRPFFRVIAGIGPDTPGKPHPAIVHRVLAGLGVGAADAVVVGDTVYDVKMASAAGVAAIGVGWGVHPTAALTEAGADAIAETLAELEALLGYSAVPTSRERA
jgi:phosphoglycolate phosphatase